MKLPPYNPINVNTNGLGCFRFARRYSGNRKNLLPERNGTFAPRPELLLNLMLSIRSERKFHCCFLFLQVLWCFTSLGTLPHTRVPAVSRWVSSFGNLGIYRLFGISPEHIAAISRPSSLLEAKASTIHPSFLQGMLYTAVQITISFDICFECCPFHLRNGHCLWRMQRTKRPGNGYPIVLTLHTPASPRWRRFQLYCGEYLLSQINPTFTRKEDLCNHRIFRDRALSTPSQHMRLSTIACSLENLSKTLPKFFD